MQKIKPTFVTLIILAFIILQFPQVSFARTQKANPSAKFALIIGINDYMGEVNDLSGTHNDVGLMKDLLQEFGFTEKKQKGLAKKFPCGRQTNDSLLKTLCSRQATKKAIIDTFKSHLIENAKKYKEEKKVSNSEGANVVFYYSGHGSFLDDDNGDETDGTDETIVPTDGEWDGTNQIRDDEINELVTELNKYTSNITLIFDNCNSGTATRGPGVKRFISKTKNANTRGSKGNDKNLQDGLVSSEGYVTISGSLPNELSYEDYFTNPKTKEDQLNGALTYYLVNIIRQNPGATYRDVMNLTKSAVVSLGRSQTPQAEGDLGRTVFGSTFSKGKIPIFPKCKDTDGEMVCSKLETRKDEEGKEYKVHKIEMNAGNIIGAREGGVIKIYDSKTQEFSGDKGIIGTGLITYADAFNAEADVRFSDTKIKKFSQNARIILLSPNFSDAKKKVALDFTPSLRTDNTEKSDDVGLKVLTDLTERLKNNSGFETVKQTKMFNQLQTNSTAKGTKKIDWDLAIVRSTYKDFKLGQEIKSSKGNNTPAEMDEVFFISDRNGMPMYGFYLRVDEQNAARKLNEALQKHVHLENLRLLKNKVSLLNKQLDIEFVRIKDLEATADGCVFNPYPAEQRAKDQKGTPKIKYAIQKGRKLDGDGFYFRIKNNSKTDLYLYIYSLDSRGEIKLIYPPKDANEKLLAGKEFNTYGRNKCRINFFSPQTSSFGKETIKFLFSEKPIPASILEQKGSAKGNEREGNSLLANLLEKSITKKDKPTSRNVSTFSGSVGDWTALNFDYEIIQ